MSLRIAAVSASRIAKPHNPSSPLFSPPFNNPKFQLHRLPHANAFPPLPIRKPGSQCYIRAISDRAVESTISKKEEEGEQSPKDWKIKMLYDGDCPLCMREVNMLRERNTSYGTIKFVDIGSDDYSPDENQGLDYQTAMGRIHAILSDGTVVTDVEAFRRLYEQVGLGWVYAITKYEPDDHLWKKY
ncbi:thiol-disulfide oxidoreductase DCC [Medicago truncatula]|uniref:Thiol-disulfide oxidoreductase DCC n=1 Tax=Medicago truncatula TaxID=3880 RepID=A0A072VA49_MEDTR|nr:thiol-disulfide oxidoreductase DCC [Medicago truncatula]